MSNPAHRLQFATPGRLAIGFALLAVVLATGVAVLPPLGVALLGLAAALAAFFLFRRLSTAALALLVASLFNGVMVEVSTGAGRLTVRPDQPVLLLLLLALVPAYLTHQVSLYHTELDLPILGFLGANIAASVLFSPVKNVSYQAIFLLTLYCLMYFVTASLLIQQPPRRVAWVAAVFAGLGVVEAAYGILTLLIYSLGFRWQGLQLGQTRNSVSIAGTFHEANLFGIYLTIIGVFLLAYLLIAEPARRWRSRLLVGVGLVSLALALTLTRSAWIMFGVSTLVIMRRGRGGRGGFLRVRRSVAIALLVMAAALVVILLLFGPLVSQLSQETNLLWLRVQRMIDLSDSSIVGRVLYYRVALERWLQRPLLGWGTFAGEVIGVRWFNASLIQALHDSGVVGLVFLLWLHVRVIGAAWREARRAPTPFYHASLFACALGNAILFLTSQASSFMWLGFPWVFMGLTIGLVHASRRERLGSPAGPA